VIAARFAAVAAVVLAATACGPYLYQTTVAPPGRVGMLAPVDDTWGLDHYKLEISEGTALAILCEDGSPCTETHAASRDAAIAAAVPAHLAQLSSSLGIAHVALPASAFVVIGRRAGVTTIDVTSKQGGRRIDVVVVPRPSPAAVLVTR
jgi:hypothetical protein